MMFMTTYHSVFDSMPMMSMTLHTMMSVTLHSMMSVTLHPMMPITHVYDSMFVTLYPMIIYDSMPHDAYDYDS